MARHGALPGFAVLWACCLAQGLFPPMIAGTAPVRIGDARRVVIFPPVLAAYATIDQGCEHIVGASTLGTDEEKTHDPLYVAHACLARVPPMATLPRGTTFPADPEQVLLQQPDTVLLWRNTGEALRSAGLPVVDIRSLAAANGASESWDLLGALAGKSMRAAQLRRATETEDAEVIHSVDQLNGKKPRFLLMWSLEDPTTYFLGPSFYGPALDLGNLRSVNMAPSHLIGRADMEQLLLLDPDIIFLTRQTPRLFYEQPLFSSLKAVRERRVYRIPPFGDRLDRFVPDHPLFLRWAAELLYPRQVTKDTRNLLRERYRQSFDVRLDEGALDRALFVEENALSAEYARFRRSNAFRMNADDRSP